MTKTERVTEPKELFDYLDSTKYEVSDARMVNDDTVEVHYTNTEEFIEQDNKTNIVIAAFTTAYARLKLYDSSIRGLDLPTFHAGVSWRVDVAWGPRKRERRRNANPSPRSRF